MTGRQEQMAVHYALLFLGTEISKIREFIEEACGNHKKLLEKRLKELKHDLRELEGLVD
jgi:DNA-binding transcriptional MerR regulator